MPYLRCYQKADDLYVAELKCEYDFDKPFKRKWTIEIDADGKITLPEELLGRLGWAHSDVLEWFATGADEFLLVKIPKS